MYLTLFEETYLYAMLFITEIKKRKQYEQHQLKEAVAAVKQGMSVRQAAIKFGVPRRTVGDHASGKIPHFHKSGLPPMLTDEEEEALVEYIQYMASRNMPLKRNDLRGTILVGLAITTNNLYQSKIMK